MASVEIKSGAKVGIEEILNGIAKLSTGELDQFRKQVNKLWESKNAQALSQKEKELLKTIRQPLLAKPDQKRYETLQAKRDNESLSSEELEEFKKFVVKLEQRGLARLESIVELSGIKGISVDNLLQELNLTLPFPEYA